MSLISKIQNLISSANAVTGESRTDLTSAVQDLKDGYGQGEGIQLHKTFISGLMSDIADLNQSCSITITHQEE